MYYLLFQWKLSENDNRQFPLVKKCRIWGTRNCLGTTYENYLLPFLYNFFVLQFWFERETFFDRR